MSYESSPRSAENRDASISYGESSVERATKKITGAVRGPIAWLLAERKGYVAPPAKEAGGSILSSFMPSGSTPITPVPAIPEEPVQNPPPRQPQLPKPLEPQTPKRPDKGDEYIPTPQPPAKPVPGPYKRPVPKEQPEEPKQLAA